MASFAWISDIDSGVGIGVGVDVGGGVDAGGGTGTAVGVGVARTMTGGGAICSGSGREITSATTGGGSGVGCGVLGGDGVGVGDGVSVARTIAGSESGLSSKSVYGVVEAELPPPLKTRKPTPMMPVQMNITPRASASHFL